MPLPPPCRLCYTHAIMAHSCTHTKGNPAHASARHMNRSDQAVSCGTPIHAHTVHLFLHVLMQMAS